MCCTVCCITPSRPPAGSHMAHLTGDAKDTGVNCAQLAMMVQSIYQVCTQVSGQWAQVQN